MGEFQMATDYCACRPQIPTLAQLTAAGFVDTRALPGRFTCQTCGREEGEVEYVCHVCGMCDECGCFCDHPEEEGGDPLDGEDADIREYNGRKYNGINRSGPGILR